MKTVMNKEPAYTFDEVKELNSSEIIIKNSSTKEGCLFCRDMRQIERTLAK
jgi:hypothetical protein